MDYNFTIKEMIKRLAEFPPKALKEKVCSTEKSMIYFFDTMVKESIYSYVASLPERTPGNRQL